MRSNYNCMSMKKKGLSLLLCAALSLSLAACSTKPETPAQPTAEPTAIPVTAAPETTAAPTETPAAENRNVPVISVRCENEDFYTADNAALLLVYACAEPSVSMNGNDALPPRSTPNLHKQYTDFAASVPNRAANSTFTATKIIWPRQRKNTPGRRKTAMPRAFLPTALCAR